MVVGTLKMSLNPKPTQKCLFGVRTHHILCEDPCADAQSFRDERYDVDCGSNGRCSDGELTEDGVWLVSTCVCDAGYAGDRCRTAVCPRRAPTAPAGLGNGLSGRLRPELGRPEVCRRLWLNIQSFAYTLPFRRYSSFAGLTNRVCSLSCRQQWI